jgi:hypothetical protein
MRSAWASLRRSLYLTRRLGPVEDVIAALDRRPVPSNGHRRGSDAGARRNWRSALIVSGPTAAAAEPTKLAVPWPKRDHPILFFVCSEGMEPKGPSPKFWNGLRWKARGRPPTKKDHGNTRKELHRFAPRERNTAGPWFPMCIKRNRPLAPVEPVGTLALLRRWEPIAVASRVSETTLPVADCKYSPHPLRVFKKRLETEVHVVLDVAMEQRRAG